MLLIVIVLRHRVTIFVRSFTSYQDLASGSFFKLLLIYAFWTNYQTNVIDSMKSRQEDLGFEGSSCGILAQIFARDSRNYLIDIDFNNWSHHQSRFLGCRVFVLLMSILVILLVLCGERESFLSLYSAFFFFLFSSFVLQGLPRQILQL